MSHLVGWSVRPLLLGAAHLALIALFIHGMSWLTTHPSVYAQVHVRQVHLAEGYILSSALAAFRSGPPPRVLIVGASTARQGFSVDAIGLAAPPFAVFNAATAGGTLLCHEILMRAVQRQDVRPEILVLSLSAMELFDQPLKQDESGYTDLLDLRDADLMASYGPGGVVDGIRKQLVLNTIFPAARHRRVVALRWRMALHGLQEACRSQPLDLVHFRLNPFEFQEPWPFPLNQVAPDLKRREVMREAWQKDHRLDADAVGQPRHFAQLDRILSAASAQAPFVVVILMPHHAWVREHVDILAQQRLLDHLAARSGRSLAVLDWSGLLSDDDFSDYVHPTARGRTRVSAALGDFLRNLPKP